MCIFVYDWGYGMNKEKKEKNKNNGDPRTKGKNAKKVGKTGIAARFNLKNELTMLLISLAASFTLFFFSPLDVFIGNQRDFIVGFGRVFPPMLIMASLSTVVLFVLQNIMLLIHEAAYIVVSRIIFGFLLAGYIQMLFLNGKMTSFTGDAYRYNDHKATVIFNAALYIALIALPLVLTILAKKLPANKVLNFSGGKIIPYMSALFFLMQLAGTGTSMLTADFSKYKKNYTSYLSYEPSMSLSKEENIIVFLVDRMDGDWMDQAVARYPELNDKLEGFTYYRNNISHNTQTFPSVPQMLTNSMYKGTEWADYVSKAWAGDTVPKNLKENGYNVNLLIDNLTTYSSVVQLKDQCDNIRQCEDDNVEFNYTGKNGIIQSLTKISLAKLSPYALKSVYTVGMGANLSSDFVKYKVVMEDRMPMATDVESDLRYNDYIRSHPLNADSEKKVFNYTHLNGAHNRSARLVGLFDKTGTEPIERVETLRGDLEIVFYYMEEMKKLGVYDNSTIIILGDHGRPPDEIEAANKKYLESPIMTSLLVKPKNAERVPLQTDSKSELTNDFFPASILEYAGIDHKKFGYSYNDVITQELHPTRYLQTYDFMGYGLLEPKTLYKITGDARDFDNWEVEKIN